MNNTYRLEDYPAEGHGPFQPTVLYFPDVESARREIARRIDVELSELPGLRWIDFEDDAIETYHASHDEGCGGFAIYSENE